MCKFNVCSLVLGAAFLCVFYFSSIGEANSFPFRSVNIGDSLPPVTVKNLRGGQDVSLGKFIGKPLLVVFFGADIPAKKKRAIKLLRAISALASFIENKGITVLVVNAQGDQADVIDDVVSESGISFGIYTDADRSAYGGLGLFVMPSILLVSSDGVVAAGLGYSRDLPKRLKAEIEVMAGDKTRSQIEEELHPKMIEKTAEQKRVKRHFNLGLTMLERGQPKSAMREFKKTIALDPDMGKAHVYLGCLQLDDGKVDEARLSLDKGLDLEPDFVDGLICQARIKVGDGDVAGALDDLEAIMFRNSRNDKLQYVVGTILAEKGDWVGAMKKYRRAYELLSKKSQVK